MLFVWIDPDLCTGTGLCVDQCPDLFEVMEDGIACVIGADGQPRSDYPGPASITAAAPRLVEQALAAALSCPGECIFLEEITTGA